MVIVALLLPAEPGAYLTLSEILCPGPSVTGKDGDAIWKSGLLISAPVSVMREKVRFEMVAV